MSHTKINSEVYRFQKYIIIAFLSLSLTYFWAVASCSINNKMCLLGTESSPRISITVVPPSNRLDLDDDVVALVFVTIALLVATGGTGSFNSS